MNILKFRECAFNMYFFSEKSYMPPHIRNTLRDLVNTQIQFQKKKRQPSKSHHIPSNLMA